VPVLVAERVSERLAVDVVFFENLRDGAAAVVFSGPWRGLR
jgi:hypothetical protein